jgi:hypothetical protein
MNSVKNISVLMILLLFNWNNSGASYIQQSSSHIMLVSSETAHEPGNLHDCSCDGDDIATYQFMNSGYPAIMQLGFIHSSLDKVPHNDPNIIWQPPKQS